MKKIILILISFIAHPAFAQQTAPSALKGIDYGRYYIQHLKQGALVVRLNFKSKALTALLKANNSNAANEIRFQQSEANTKIMSAFRKHFKFCPVYFISYDSTLAFVDGRRNSIFLDQDLEIDTSIHPVTDFFLIAETGTLDTQVAPDMNHPEQETTQRGLMEDALVIRDAKLMLLHDPFPYYVRQQNNWDNRVKKLEKKLHNFYEVNK